MRFPDITIAIDGFSSTGKSTLARLIAQHFDFLYLDSGAMYRGVTLFAQEQGLIASDNTIDPVLEKALETLDLHFGQGTVLFLGERNIEKEIRTMEVSSQVSPIAAVPYVRAYVDRRLHEFSAAGRVVMDGRDIGTTVFPDAEVKIFMTARPEVRTQRRFDELVSKGENPVFEEVMKNLLERDYIDSHRATSPLRRAEDAFELDNSEMGLTDEIAWAEGLIRGKFGLLDAPGTDGGKQE
ncbi:MAG: (d)CMP kinase [Bacteroidales bacterium]|nr:(d)CMP kinase [Bacteroidales bacterium]